MANSVQAASEALHVLDALLYHQSEVATRRHHTDGGGDSDHVFALCTLVGLQFAPRIPDLKHRRLFSFDKPSAYPALEPMIAGRINVELVRAYWSEILRIIASIRTGTVTAPLIMRQLASYPRLGGIVPYGFTVVNGQLAPVAEQQDTLWHIIQQVKETLKLATT
jgi:TnpA family transposase